ncbi:MAG: hypothetical protein HYU27_07845 [Acidobacteria bacterium]|nr:hypothetical protein [Acidobacteriota bacterium]
MTAGDKAGAGLVRGRIDIGAITRTALCSPYLRLITLLLALSAIVTLIVDFQFKLIVQDAFQSKDDLTAFFGSFYAYIGFFSFLLQFLAGTRISERYGVRLTLLLLPLALLAGTLVLLAFPLRLWTGVLLKGSDGSLRYSIDKSTLELLYVPLPQYVKAEIKAVIDMVFQRFADGAGGILLLLMIQLGFGLTGTAIFNLVLIAGWGFAAARSWPSRHCARPSSIRGPSR